MQSRTRTCGRCGKEYTVSPSTYNQQKKRQTKNTYCSAACRCKIDKYSRFRSYYKWAKRRANKKNLIFTITLEDLLHIWDRQKGLCMLTGLPLSISASTTNSLGAIPFMASLDRIDSKQGYEPHNIQWVCYIGQVAKNKFSDEALEKFCISYVNHNLT